jgi:hypothetical protein
MDPIKDIAIAGALNGEFGLPKEELGDHDTTCDESHPLYDKRLIEALDKPFINNIDAFGVMSPIKIAKIGEIAFVVFGRRRVRAARVVCRQRAKRGEPMLTVKCDIIRGPDTLLMGNMVSENEHRTDDSYEGRLNKLLRMMERGVALADCAISFGKSEATLQSWIDFHDKASAPVKRAVESGRMSISTGINVMRAGDAEAQKKAMGELEAQIPEGSRITNNQAKQAAKRATAKTPESTYEMGTKRELKQLLEAVEKMDHGRHGPNLVAYWEGVEQALQLVIGTDKLDERLIKLVNKVREGS